MIKRTFILAAALLIHTNFAQAQQKPQYTQYMLNSYLLNPAFAGIENYIDIKAGHRSQWKGLEGAPETNYLTVTMPIGEGFLNGGPGSGNPSGRAYTQNYMAAEPHHGVGLSIFSDKAGLLQSSSINGSYAYHLGLSPTLNMALGVAAGVSRYSLNSSKVTTTDPGDPLINGGNTGAWNPDISIGTVAYSSDYYVGVSVQQLFPQRMFTSNALQDSKTVPHFFVTGGVRLFLTEELTLVPSALIKVIRPLPLAYDVNVKLSFRDVFWIGSSYRKDDSMGAFAGVNISSLISVGYSYDMNTSYLNTVSHGTHEIVLGIMLNNKYEVKCPQRSF
ncbi:MAG: type IX secretion system membrane protein PorP/SprF [Sphingobacteriaceae bacterium]|nr:MAG: type IX secretion system membrane protein PorP/SprF [Sphingobacteriaceae bacterium]